MQHRTDMPSGQKSAGFTIIEVLVAIALFAIVILMVLAPLTGLFGLTQKSAQQTSATNLAEQAIEQIRGQWLNANRYGNNCVAGPLPSVPTTPVVTVQDEDVQGNSQTNATTFMVGDSMTCPAVTAVGTTAPKGPPLRRITVAVRVNGTTSSTSSLIAEVARP